MLETLFAFAFRWIRAMRYAVKLKTVGTASVAKRLKPDIVLLGHAMPNMNGLEAPASSRLPATMWTDPVHQVCFG